ncbi:MAG: hypothetical protein ABI696_03405 [Rubrivivax sp.]
MTSHDKHSPPKSDAGIAKDDPALQGEGNVTADRRYREDATRHAQSGTVTQEARDAAPRDSKEAEALRRAEEEGKRHAKK